jgi:uncharacterized protein
MNMVIILDPDHLALLRKVVGQVAPGVPAFVYGSRAHGRSLRPFSDLDICLKDTGPVAETTMSALREAFDASNLPIRVDVVDWHGLDIAFAERIERDFVRL